MTPLTQPIRVIYNTRERGYRVKTWLAYTAVFTLMAGDAVRYTLGWWGWGALLIALLVASATLFLRNQPLLTLRNVPWPLASLLALMLISTLWSAYPTFTLIGSGAQFATTVFALFLAGSFSWRHLLKIFANSIRLVLAASMVFEFIAAAIVRGPIAPIFGNYEGDTPPAAAFYWTQGNLFDGERIQGIVGNSNLLAYAAMVGFIVFAVEYAIIGAPRWLSASSMVTAALSIALAKSAGIGFAMVAVGAAAIVSIAAEGKDREIRHRYYRVAWASAGTIAFFVLVYRAEVFEFFGKSPDMTGRSGIWKLVLGLIEQRPLQGWGWISHWMPGVAPFEGLVVIGKVPYYQAHNAYLDMWLQLGLIGVALFGALLLITFVKLWRLAVRHTSALYLWPILVFVGLLVWSLTESRMLIEIGWVLLVLFAVKVNEPEEGLEPRGRSPKRARLLSRGPRQNRPQPHTDR